MPTANKDYLWLNLKSLPYFRSLLRAVEAKIYQDIELEHPILDVGCGDGHFASVAFNEKLDVGIDPWREPLAKAFHYEGYRYVIQGSGSKLPFSNGFFSSAISNSVLEHIEDVQSVLNETSRVLKSGSLFVFCVPNHQFLSSLSIGKTLDHLGLRYLANIYRTFFNRISRHKHCDAPETWKKRLEISGFEIIKGWHYFSLGAFHVLEWGHYFGLPSWLIYKFTGKYILVSKPWNLWITRRLIEKYYLESDQQTQGSYTFFITRKLVAK